MLESLCLKSQAFQAQRDSGWMARRLSAVSNLDKRVHGNSCYREREVESDLRDGGKGPFLEQLNTGQNSPNR